MIAEHVARRTARRAYREFERRVKRPRQAPAHGASLTELGRANVGDL